MQPVYLLGLGMPAGKDSSRHILTHPLVAKADALIGGRSQLAPFSSHPAKKLVVDADVEGLYRRIALLRDEGKILVALCSGDPLYFGLGARLAERFGPEAVRAIPGLSSMQAAAAFLGIPWEGMRSVSLHGRGSMLSLAHALMDNNSVCLLCDAATSPARIAGWMLERGCACYEMHLLGTLRMTDDGTVTSDSHSRLSLHDAARNAGSNPPPSLIILKNIQDGKTSGPFGVDDLLLETDRGVYTKQPIRAAGLASLGIAPEDTVWDIGAGSGAVSIDAARLAWRGQVFSFEARENRLAAIFNNRRSFGALNMEIVPGDFPACLETTQPLAKLSRPNKIFVGGGLGTEQAKAEALLLDAWQALLPGGSILAHCVLLSSLELARSTLCGLAGSVSVQSIQVAQSAPICHDLQLKAINPVFLVLAAKPH